MKIPFIFLELTRIIVDSRCIARKQKSRHIFPANARRAGKMEDCFTTALCMLGLPHSLAASAT